MSVTEGHIEQPERCDRCGKCFTESALLPYRDMLLCQHCWRREVQMGPDDSGFAVALLILILALIIILPFWILL